MMINSSFTSVIQPLHCILLGLCDGVMAELQQLQEDGITEPVDAFALGLKPAKVMTFLDNVVVLGPTTDIYDERVNKVFAALFRRS
ncbi:hypothetical protein MHYP_G00186360 [Metynnis hypsauchen]